MRLTRTLMILAATTMLVSQTEARSVYGGSSTSLLRVVNRTGVPIKSIVAKSDRTGEVTGNLLTGLLDDADGYVGVNGSGGCQWTLTARFTDGDVVRNSIDMCETNQTWTLQNRDENVDD